MISRRAFLGGAAVSIVAGRSRLLADVGSPAMPTRVLGRTGLRVPVLEVGGTYRFTRRYVQRAIELGCTFFDTAASYVNGASETTLGQSIAALGVRRKVTIVTKGHPRDPGGLAHAVEASSQRLRSDTIDVYYLHNLSRPEVVADPEWEAAVAELQRRGRIRHFGFSCHNEHVVPLLHAAAKSRFVDVVMFKYNFRSYGDQELNGAIDVAHKAGIGLIAMKTQGSAISFSERVNPFVEQGLSKHQAVLKAVWKDERIASAVSCMPSVQVLEQNAAATHQALTAAETEAIERYAAATRSLYCPGGCGGCRRECEAATGHRIAIADTLRYLMYHDSYGWREEARRKYARLAINRKLLTDKELRIAAAACPKGVAVRELVARADRMLSA